MTRCRPILCWPRWRSRSNAKEGSRRKTRALQVSHPAVIHLLLIFLGAVLVTPFASFAEPISLEYRDDLIAQARISRLAQEREWHLLLHYTPNLFGGVTSEQDDEGFFLSPDGKVDPQAELDATIGQFFVPDLVGRSKQPAQCAFIARYHWLKERLHADPARLPSIPCERFDRWRAELNP